MQSISVLLSFFLITLISLIFAAQKNELQNPLSVEGATVMLPISAAKEPFSLEFIQKARKNFNNFHWQMGGDHALYYNTHLSEFLPTAMAAPNEHYKPLQKAIDPSLGKLKVKTKARGELTLDEYVNDPQFRVQGFILLHHGKIVYEAYPGMRPIDSHFWASMTKTTVGLVIAMLVEEGKIDPNRSVTSYVPELKGSNWDSIKVINLLNHASALDIEENSKTLMDPKSVVVRFFAAVLGSANYEGKKEDWFDVVRDAKKLKNEKQGERFRYSSINTMVLVKMVEHVEKKSWIEIFDERVWGNMTARGCARYSLAPDGTAIAMGVNSTTLEDAARFALLFTPSYKAAATKRIVTPNVLRRIRNSGKKEAFFYQENSKNIFGEVASYNSYQFDYIFDDGAMGKSGNMGQFIYVDPARDFVGVAFATLPLHSGYMVRRSLRHLCEKQRNIYLKNRSILCLNS